ncbi:MAG: imelysin family protein [Pseudonocardiaceae bacterium]
MLPTVVISLREGAVLLASTAVLVAGCSGPGRSAQPAHPTTEVKIALSDAGCEPQPASVPAGPVTFTITNSGSRFVTEVELLREGKIMGEKEGLTPGVSGGFSLRLDEGGAYLIHCAGGSTNSWPLTVNGGSGQAGAAPGNASLATATQGYHDYVVTEVDQLATTTKQFTDAVRAGDMDKARQTFPLARLHYESIEPVAESFGDLDPSIDARIDDVGNPADWTGFHRIEKAMWEDKTLDGMSPFADKLDADMITLKSKVAGETYQTAQLANGAVELLKPAVAAKDADLAQRLEARFTDVADKLSKHRQGDGYVDYSTVPEDQRRELADAVNALAEPLSRVAGLVV